MLLVIIIIISCLSMILQGYEMWLDCTPGPFIDYRRSSINGDETEAPTPLDGEEGRCSRRERKTRELLNYILGSSVGILVGYGFLAGKLSLPTLFK